MTNRPPTEHDETLAPDETYSYSDIRTKKRSLEADKNLGIANDEPSSKRKSATEPSKTMPRSASPPGSNLTKTGRVSKATKGQPVHHCHCGKTYTRAEHLRRHQQNHKPGAFPCDVQGCERAFNREDLLIRHKIKHDDLSNSSAPLQPHGDEGPSKLFQDAHAFEIRASSSSSDPPTGVQYAETRTHESYVSIAEQQISSTGLVNDYIQPAVMSESSFLSLDNGYLTPKPVYGLYDSFPGLLPIETESSWMRGSSTLHTSHSPVSEGSITPAHFWRGSSPAYAQLRTPNSETSICALHDDAATTGTFHTGNFTDRDSSIIPEFRDMREQDELVTPTSAPQAATFGPNQYHHHADNQQRYLEAFWECVHPSWPVTHRPSFHLSSTSPLLLASMVTLGAHSTGNQIDAANACILHKRCLKVLKQRSIDNSHTYRLCDMQAVLMVELFSISRSRRPPLQLSEAFVNSYRSLALDELANTTDMFFACLDSFGSFQDQATPSVPFDHEAKQRLLAAYYILDQQHATLFGRQAVNMPEFVPGSITLPQPLSLWDMGLANATSCNAQISGACVMPLEPRPTLQIAAAVPRDLVTLAKSEPFDIFSSMLLIAYTSGDKEESVSLPIVEASLSKCPQAQLAWHTSQLCSNTPIRSLLAVAGESWVMAEKLGSRAEYTTSQETVRRWTANSRSKNALVHSRALLRLHKSYARTAFVFHEWSLHLACLVLWACAYASRRMTRQLRLSIPSSTLSFATTVAAPSHELDINVEGSVQQCIEGNDHIAWQDVKRVLTWAKAKIAKTGATRFCGLTSGAVDVLGSLVARGEENEWF